MRFGSRIRSLAMLSTLALPAAAGCAGNADAPEARDDEHLGSTTQAFTTPTNLLIITSDLLAPALQKLADHKNATGMSATVLTMAQVKAMSGGADYPERIKRTIASYVQNSGTRYILLGGDPSQVPTRHRAVVAEDHVQVLSQNFTDHYYANLYKNHNADGSSAGVVDTWDANGDGRLNTEYWDTENADVANPDGVDGYPDVAVGRVPLNTAAAMTQYVSKVIAYEKQSLAAPKPTNAATFVQDYLYAGADTLSLQIESNLTWPSVQDAHQEINAPGSVAAPWSPANATTIANAAGQSGLMFYVGHGAWNQWDGVFYTGSVNSLGNTAHYPIVYAAGCETAQFAPMDLYPSGPPNDYASQLNSFGAAWLAPSYTGVGGSVAYIGETLVMPNGPGAHMAGVFGRLASSGVRVLGDAWHLAQVEYWRTQPRDNILGAPRIFLSIETLLGDPSLRMNVARRNRAAMPLADFDGDGRSDTAVFRPSNGTWYIKNSSGLDGRGGFPGQIRVQYGQAGDIPIPGDFDGDGVTDIAVFRPSIGSWFIVNTSHVTGIGGVTGQTRISFGVNGDIPVSGDFDGDGATDIAVFRPSNGTWYIRNSSGATGVGGVAGQTRISHGVSGDVPLAGDFDGDGMTDIAVFRPSNGTWYIRNSSGITGAGGFAGQTRIVYGGSGDVPVVSDYDSDGKSDIAIFRKSAIPTWFVRNSSGVTGPGSASGQTVTQLGFNDPNQVPLASDYNGDGKADLAVWSAISGTGDFEIQGMADVSYGTAGDLPAKP